MNPSGREASYRHPAKRSLADVAREARTDTRIEDLAPGTPVRIATPYCDGYFWDGETGVVEVCGEGHLGVLVRLDEVLLVVYRKPVTKTLEKTHHGFYPHHLAPLRDRAHRGSAP